jgi:hypothetical protein
MRDIERERTIQVKEGGGEATKVVEEERGWKLGYERSTETWRGGRGGVGAGDLEESLPNILGVGIKFPRSPVLYRAMG